jgi:hypothetical protein
MEKQDTFGMCLLEKNVLLISEFICVALVPRFCYGVSKTQNVAQNGEILVVCSWCF